MVRVITMTDAQKRAVADSVREFRLPRYHEIPDVGLYLEQTTKYIAGYLSPLQEGCITSSMISNYVKKGLIESPVKKRYCRDQIAYLVFIAVAKNVLSLDALTDFIHLQQQTYSVQKAYDYFCEEFENILQYTFELKDTVDVVGEDSTDEKRLLYSCVAAVVQMVYLEKCLSMLAAREE